MVANRVSYHLNLTGPSVTVDTACSASLMAVHLALPGPHMVTATLSSPRGEPHADPRAVHLLYPGRAVRARRSLQTVPAPTPTASAAVRCRHCGPAPAQRCGRRPPAGSRDHRRERTNQDGKSNGITAPNRGRGQCHAPRARSRGAAARDVTFVEAHGTGTVLGDMIEANALGDLHRTGRDKPRLLGSIKGNIGHLEGAAGIAALINPALPWPASFLRRSRQRPNPALRLEQQGLQLATSPVPLGENQVLAASSYGLGGSNVHVMLASPPAPRDVAGNGRGAGRRDHGVRTLSGRAAPQRRRSRTLDACSTHDVAALCCNRVKSSLKHRFAAAGTRTDLARACTAMPPRHPASTNHLVIAAVRRGSGCCAPVRVPNTPA